MKPDIDSPFQQIQGSPAGPPVSVSARTPQMTALGGGRSGGVTPYNPAKAGGGAAPGDPRLDAVMSMMKSGQGPGGGI